MISSPIFYMALIERIDGIKKTSNIVRKSEHDNNLLNKLLSPYDT